jgi:hypothetical protein
MARQVQLRRGTTAEHSTFTGAVGEVTVDTDKDVAVVHDGSTAGGFPLMRPTHTGDVDITGELIADSYNETFAAVTSTANATTINCEAGNNFSHILAENTTFTFSNPPATGTAYGLTLKIVQDAGASGFAVTWPASVDYASATAPTLTATASAVDVLVFYTHDGGTNWYGFVAGQAMGTPE